LRHGFGDTVLVLQRIVRRPGSTRRDAQRSSGHSAARLRRFFSTVSPIAGAWRSVARSMARALLRAPARPLMKILKIFTFSILTLTLGMIGCSGQSNDDSDGDNSDGDGAGCSVPACILRMYELVVSCTPTGTCVAQTNETGVNQCYSDGRRMSIVTSDSGNGTLLLTNPDGSTCVSEEVVNDGGTFRAVVRDASGAALGTLTANADGATTISCDGRTYQQSEYDCDGNGDDDDDGESVACTMGTCP